MRTSRCAFSTAAALHRVFIAPSERPSLQLLQRRRPALPTYRSFSITHCRPVVIFNTDIVAEKSRLPRNEEIQAHSRRIRLISPNNEMGPEVWVDRVLELIDRKVDQLQVMNLVPEDGGAPLCRIQNIAEQRQIEKMLSKKTNGLAGSKEVELNWAIEKGDLKHRMNTLKKFLQKGMKVEIVLAGKKGGRRATEEEANALIARIMEVVEEVEGAKTTAEPEGVLLKTMRLKMAGKVVEKQAKKRRMMTLGCTDAEEGEEGQEGATSLRLQQSLAQLAEINKRASVELPQSTPRSAPPSRKFRDAAWAPPPAQRPRDTSWATPAQKAQPAAWTLPPKQARPQPTMGKGKAPNVPDANLGSNPSWAALMKASGSR